VWHISGASNQLSCGYESNYIKKKKESRIPVVQIPQIKERF
jgi:hypothetical protein